MANEIKKSLKYSLESLKGVCSKLYKEFPYFVFIISFLILMILMSIGISGFSVQFILSIFLSILSIIIYITKKSATESILTLFLGMLTIYSITWDTKTAILCIFLIFSAVIMIAIISSIRIASELETIKIQASNFIHGNMSHDQKMRRIEQIIKIKPTVIQCLL